MKQRKSLVKPVTRQNISSCSVLSPEIVMHDAFNVYSLNVRRCVVRVQWSNCRGTRVNGVPLPFLAWERRSPSQYDRCGWTWKTAFSRSMTATYNTSNRKKCALNAFMI